MRRKRNPILRYTRQALAAAGILLAVLVILRMIGGNTYRAAAFWDEADPPAAVQVDDPAIARAENPRLENGRITVDIIPLQKGPVIVQFLDRDGQVVRDLYLRVSRLGTVYNMEDGGFTGDIVLLSAVTLYLFLLSAMMLHGFLTAKGSAVYAYSTMFYIGFFFFALLSALTMLTSLLMHVLRPQAYSMSNVYSSMSSASATFLALTSPVLLVFSLAVAVSNIELLRHNRPRIQNALGLLTGVLIIGGALFGLWLTMRDFSGSLLEYRINATVQNVYCTLYVYFECVLAGAVICGLRAARHRVDPGRGIIIILGCWFRKDGSLPPLLRGRVDRAIEYWRETREKTGTEAFIIPSGGRGPDESMPEAEAMRNYLLAHGIPEEKILPETGSASTWENMRFSRRVMEEHHLSGSVVYATTSYHVFRSGMWAARAGLEAEGISSRTKWWFWPNAFLRECISLLANRWKLELLLLLAMSAFFALLNMTIIG